MSKFTRLAFFALAFLLILTFLRPDEKEQSTDDVILETDNKIAIGDIVQLEVFNNSQTNIKLPSNCPQNPLKVEKYINGEWITQTAEIEEECNPKDTVIQPGETYIVNYAPWNFELFSEKGSYQISLEVEIEGKEKSYTEKIEVGSRSIFGVIWQEVFYKPIFNTLIFFISILPGNNLGFAVILLTILIKLILLIPNQKALKAQKRMQKVQPQLEALKKKYQNDPQQLAAETMKIWQTHKVSPVSSCLPLLIQFPILVALFYVVKNGLEFINPQLLYGGLKSFDASSIDPIFLGIIDLTKVNAIALPIIIGGLQFIQMKLSLGKTLEKQGDQNPAMPMMGKTMLYVMPVLIAVFTATLPAAVGFYWGTSTLFGIGQQAVVNRSKD